MSGDPVGRPSSNLVLTGFMGTGKTTVGRLVAERLDLEFVDTDEVIEARHGPIPEIFAEEGEAGFRAIERTVARQLGERRGLVVATGGRMMLDPDNQASLGATGLVLCLTAPAEELGRRLLDDASTVERPLLAGPDPAGRIAELLAERAPHYGRIEQVPTGGRTPAEVADDVVERWHAAIGP